MQQAARLLHQGRPLAARDAAGRRAGISFDHIHQVNFKLYTKPTFTGSYLLTNSNHPKHTFRGIIISLINRIRRTNSNLNSYYLDCIILLKHLTNNGYPYNLISNIIFSFANKDRNSLIEYKTNNFDNKNSIYFISFYNKDCEIEMQILK